IPPVYCWIIGHSYVKWAALRATERTYKRQLGLSEQEVRIRWRGIPGLQWKQILPEVLQLRGMGPGPKILVIHAGGNDLGTMKNVDLINNIKQDIAKCCARINGLIVVWSEVVARSFWRGARNHKAIEKCRIKLNVSVSKFVKSIGGISIRHRELEKDNKSLLRNDGVHLNPIGLDILNMDFYTGIEKALAVLGRKSS
ncbi:hypothetical protein XELAEV_18027775mg, partial [Xenopus laevis]